MGEGRGGMRNMKLNQEKRERVEEYEEKEKEEKEKEKKKKKRINSHTISQLLEFYLEVNVSSLPPSLPLFLSHTYRNTQLPECSVFKFVLE
jgi:hypothetical protein